MTAGRRDHLLAAASGLLLGAAFVPGVPAALAWVAFVPLLVALERRVAAGARRRSFLALGLTAGFVFFLVGLHWIALLADVALTVPWIKYLAWVLAAGYLSWFWGLAALLTGVLSRRSGVPARWAFVPAMLAIEELRGSGELGFPWFQPGYTQHAVLPVLQLAAWGSVTLVTAWVLGINAALVHAARGRRARIAPLALLALLPLAAAVGLGARPARVGGGDALRVVLVQGNIPGEVKWSGEHQGEILQRFLALSDSAVRAAPPGTRHQLVVWPETATGSYLRRQLDQAIQVAAFATASGASVFTGYADYQYGADGRPVPRNAAGVFAPGRGLPDTSYAKRHLVPFGERMPFQWLVPALGRLDFGQAEWAPGEGTVLFPSPAGPYAALVCFESIFPDLARRDVRAGARWLVNITNDEWFGNGAALAQHADMAPFRAVENGVPLLRCANTGLTCAIDSRGRVLEQVPVFEAQVLAVALDPGESRRWRATPYVRLGDWPGLLAAVAVLALMRRRPTAAVR